MNVKVIAKTCEISESGEVLQSNTFGEDAYILGGRAGGTCYAKDGYFDKGIYDTERALRIAKRTSESGHHSVFEHSYVTLLISGIPKMTAMLLNSVGSYVTSEKSARYTVMNPDNEIEKQMYNKWENIFEGLISKRYGDKDISVKKLAMENARYMTSVFTPTSMVYTVSFRELCYIINWMDDFLSKVADMDSKFYNKLADSVKELKELFIKTLGIDSKVLVPNKVGQFNFLETVNGNDFKKIKPVISDTYTLKYIVSMACLAQIQRHRTTRCGMYFNDKNDPGFYVPDIISHDDVYRKEWLEDLHKLYEMGVYPQALLVEVVERGLVTDYLMKAQERLCGRAQLEIMQNTSWGMYTIKFSESQMSDDVREKFEKWFTTDGKLKTRCQVMKCPEPCAWGAKEGLFRSI